MRMRLIQLLVIAVSCTVLGGCAGKPARSDVQDYLEETTGTTITSVRNPAAFVHEVPELAASGRDYVYLAPIAVSRGGERSFWLWLGAWSTVDRKARHENARPLGIGPIQILADGEPMELELQPADGNPAGIRRIPYSTPVNSLQQFMAPVTRSQLQRLSHARVLTLADQPDDETARLWHSDEQASAMLSSFADQTLAAEARSAPDSGR